MASVVDAALSNPMVQANLGVIAIQDTIHDFWDGGRGEADPTTDETILKMRTQIDEIAILLLASPENPIAPGGGVPRVTFGDVHVTAGTGAWIDKPAKYERNMIDNWEQRLPTHLYSQSKESITYDDILANPEAVKARFAANRGFCNILSIAPATGTFFDSYTTAQRNTIADFILTFMFEQPQSLFGVTYDAGPVAVRKTFADISQGYTYIYPQNISDSAVTSFKSKQNSFIFPADSQVKSNLLSSGMTRMVFQNRGFTQTNPYAFNWVFSFPPQSPTPPITIQFSSEAKDGPSVNYLLDSFENGVTAATERKKPGMVNLTPISELVKATKNGLLYDLKRSGDFEQVHASLNNRECIFATIDHLCSFYARMLHKNCIWSNNASSEMILYRFPTTPLSENDQIILKICLFAAEQHRRLALIQAQSTTSILKHTYNEFAKGTTAIFRTKSGGGVEKSEQLFANVQSVTAQSLQAADVQNSLADTLTTAFLRYKCHDTALYIQKLQADIQAIATSIQADVPALANGQFIGFFNEAAKGPEALIATFPPGTAPEAVKNVLLQIDQTVTALKGRLEASKLFLDIQLTSNPMAVGVGLFNPDNTLHQTASNLTFGFSNGHFKAIRSEFRSLIGLLSSTRASRDRISKIYQHLASFFQARTDLLNTFNDKDLVEQYNAASNIRTDDIASGTDDEQIAALQVRAFQMVGRLYVSSPRVRLEPIPISPAGGGLTSIMSGGGHAERVGQTFDTSCLFRDICGKAADFVNAKISENSQQLNNAVAQGYSPVHATILLVGNTETCQEVLDDIQEYWESQLQKIRESATDLYGFPYENNFTDVMISLLLSIDPNSGASAPYYNDTPLGVHDVNQLNAIGNELLTFPQVVTTPYHRVARTLVLLMLFDNCITKKEGQVYLKDFSFKKIYSFDAPAKWDNLPKAIRSLNQVIIGGRPQTKESEMLASEGGKRKTRKRKSKKRKTYRKKKLF